MMRGFFTAVILLVSCFFTSCGLQEVNGCLTGAFIADRPTTADLDAFQRDYGKKPYLVMTFLDWGKMPDESVIRDVYGQGCALMITWEPWIAETKAPIDYENLLRGGDDAYVAKFARKLKAVDGTVFLRFAHEMNGDWYPWSGAKIGGETYRAIYLYVRKIFDKLGVKNVRWIFSINAENVPVSNDPALCYPGDGVVDYVGLDGYNWGTTRSWSHWRSFKDIFSRIYDAAVRVHRKPVIITEFASASKGGDKAVWIEEAFRSLKKMPKVEGFVLFNVNKEADWSCPPGTASGRSVTTGLSSPYFHNEPQKEL